MPYNPSRSQRRASRADFHLSTLSQADSGFLALARTTYLAYEDHLRARHHHSTPRSPSPPFQSDNPISPQPSDSASYTLTTDNPPPRASPSRSPSPSIIGLSSLGPRYREEQSSRRINSPHSRIGRSPDHRQLHSSRHRTPPPATIHQRPPRSPRRRSRSPARVEENSLVITRYRPLEERIHLRLEDRITPREDIRSQEQITRQTGRRRNRRRPFRT